MDKRNQKGTTEMSKALECAREVTDTAYTETGEGGHFIVESFAAAIIQRYLDEAEERGAEKAAKAMNTECQDIMGQWDGSKSGDDELAALARRKIEGITIDIKQVLKG